MNHSRFHIPKLFWLTILLLVMLPAWGQVKYPVTVSGYQVRPSLFLDDYTLAGTRNMSAAIVLNDLSKLMSFNPHCSPLLLSRKIFTGNQLVSSLWEIISGQCQELTCWK
jgi:hypothetical protein